MFKLMNKKLFTILRSKNEFKPKQFLTWSLQCMYCIIIKKARRSQALGKAEGEFPQRY